MSDLARGLTCWDSSLNISTLLKNTSFLDKVDVLHNEIHTEYGLKYHLVFFNKNKPDCIALYNPEREGGFTGGVSTLFYKGIIIIEGICYLLLRSIDDEDDNVDEWKGGHMMNARSEM